MVLHRLELELLELKIMHFHDIQQFRNILIIIQGIQKKCSSTNEEVGYCHIYVVTTCIYLLIGL